MSGDRRISKTRERLVAAFRELILERGYSRVSAFAIAQHANVGRSTFYEHFENKDDLFRTSLSEPLAVLASAVGLNAEVKNIATILEHFAANRCFALTVLNGPTRTLAARALSEQIERLLPSSNEIAAATISGAQLGMLCRWLEKPKPGNAMALAAALKKSSRALKLSLVIHPGH